MKFTQFFVVREILEELERIQKQMRRSRRAIRENEKYS